MTERGRFAASHRVVPALTYTAISADKWRSVFPIPQPKHMPCPECGASVARVEIDDHTCDDERWLDYQMFQLRDEVAGLDGGVATYFDSAAGRFELWYAERMRRRGSGPQHPLLGD